VKVFLIRTERKSTHTLGVLVVGDTKFYIIERPWLNNQRNISCIPSGTYQVDYLARSASGKYKKCYHVRNVPNRGGILIHNGNLVKHSKGCLINGKRAGFIAGARAVLSSRTAMRELHKLIGPNSFTLEII
jgi:basic membrane lipoprotein Med (substrate-binding protein (PBP1-ABC) superfamily)